MVPDLDVASRRAEAMKGLFEVHLNGGQYAEALAAYTQVQELLPGIDVSVELGNTIKGLGDTHIHYDRYKEALEAHHETQKFREC